MFELLAVAMSWPDAFVHVVNVLLLAFVAWLFLR